jgi:hypothetical protein
MGFDKNGFGPKGDRKETQKFAAPSGVKRGRRLSSFTTFKVAFWSTFIGLTLFSAFLWIGSALLEKIFPVVPSGGNRTGEVSKKQNRFNKLLLRINRFLKENNSIILAEAWLKSQPQIEKLKEETLKDIENRTEQALKVYFSKAKTEGVEKFLNWLYSFGTDYIILLKQAETFYRDAKCFKKLPEIEKYLLSCGGDRKSCLQKAPREIKACLSPSPTERYIEMQVEKYLINPRELEKLLSQRVFPYANEKLEEFQLKSLSILKKNYKKVALERVKTYLEKNYPGLNRKELNELLRELEQKPEFLDIGSVISSDTLKRVGEKVSVAVAAAVGYKLALKVAERIAFKIDAKILSKLAQKLAAKAGSKLASVLAGFGSGVAVCAETGPVSLLCGVVGGVIAWVATDYAINKLDEVLSRKEMRLELVKMLNNAERQVLKAVVDRYKRAMDLWIEALRETVKGKVKLKGLGNG